VAGTIGDVVQLVFSGDNLGQQFQNVHFYRVEDAPSPGYLEGLATEFESTLLPLYAAVQNDSTGYASLSLRNIFSGDEYVLAPVTPTAGSSGGTGPLASFVAASIKLVRSNARVRHGRKAICGMSESDAEGQTWSSGTMTALQALADGLAAELNPGLADLFKPVIVKRIFHPADPPDHPNDWYTLPETQVEMGTNWAYVISGLPSGNVSTQNSRKIGHGS